MRIPFDIKYRPQIESGEYKVVDKDNHNIRIICWDKKSEKKYGYHIVGLVEFGPDHEESTYYTIDGKGRLRDKQPCLFIVTPEEEKLTPFEVEVKSWMGVAEDIVIDDSWVKTCAKALLSLAREQFIKDGYVIEKKAFHDAVKKVDPGIMKEVSKNVDAQIALRTEYEKGRADALKDLPRWKKFDVHDPHNDSAFRIFADFDGDGYISTDLTDFGKWPTHYLDYKELRQLPKED